MWWRRSAASSSKRKLPKRNSPVARLRRFLGRPMRVLGTSMLPVLRPGDIILVRHSAYRRSDPRRGEIVVARPSSLGGRALVKRVCATPHEEIAWASPLDCAQGPSLGADEYFLLGDHAADSLDSRKLGPITRRELIGRAWLRVWPPRILRVPS